MNVLVTEDVLDLAEELLLSEDRDTIRSTLDFALQRSAIVTHDFGNRRYGNLLFNIKDGELVDIGLVDERKQLCVACFNTDLTPVKDDYNGTIDLIPCLHDIV